jgi:thiol:disulfide interchange protein
MYNQFLNPKPMKKLLQLSLIALAGQVAFSCSTAKQYEFAAKDSAYGYKAPKKEAVVVAEDLQVEATVPEDVLFEASATELVVAENPGTNAVPAAPPAYAKVTAPSNYPAVAAASPAAVKKTSASEAKPVLTKADVKKLKKEIKDFKKTTQLDRNLKMALVLILVGIIVSLFSGAIPLLGVIAGLLVLAGLIFGVLWLVNL